MAALARPPREALNPRAVVLEVIHISDVVLPNGTKPTIARNFVIANIGAPSGFAAAEEEAAPAA